MTVAYLTMIEVWRLNAASHQTRGDAYLRDGNQEYAAGSFRKRDRWLARIAKHEAMSRPVELAGLGPFVDALAKVIAKDFIMGGVL